MCLKVLRTWNHSNRSSDCQDTHLKRSNLEITDFKRAQPTSEKYIAPLIFCRLIFGIFGPDFLRIPRSVPVSVLPGSVAKAYDALLTPALKYGNESERHKPREFGVTTVSY